VHLLKQRVRLSMETAALVTLLYAGAIPPAAFSSLRFAHRSLLQEFRSPMDGALERVSVKEADSVNAGQVIVTLTPDRATVSDALQALAYVGTNDDLPMIDAYAHNAANEADLRQVAVEAAKSIRARNRQ